MSDRWGVNIYKMASLNPDLDFSWRLCATAGNSKSQRKLPAKTLRRKDRLKTPPIVTALTSC